MNKVFNAIFLVVTLGAMCFLSWYGRVEPRKWEGDFSQYILQAQSILNGKPLDFIESNRFTLENSTRKVGPVAYPWGFPVLLAPFYSLFGLNIVALKSLNIICYILFIIFLWFGFRRYHSPYWRAVLVCLFAFNPYFLRFMSKIISDIPFLLFSTLSILYMGRVVIQRRRLVSKKIDQLLLVAVIAISFFIRTEGILILGTLVITQFIMVVKNVIAQQKENTASTTEHRNILLLSFYNNMSSLCRLILPCICFLIIIVFWRMVLPEGGTSHIGFVKHISSGIIKDNLIYYFKLPGEFFTGLDEGVGQTIYGATLPMFIVGAFKRRHSDYHIITYGALIFLLFIVWPAEQGLRYLFPVLPFYVSFVLTGLKTFHDSSDEILGVFWRVISVCSVVVVIIFFLRVSINDASKNITQQRMRKPGPFLSTSKTLFSYISKNTEKDSIIIFFKPRIMRLLANRQAILVDQVDKLALGDYLCLYLHKNDYHQIEKKEVASLLEEDKIRLLYENTDFRLYRIIK